MNKTRFMLILAFVAVFVAGAAAMIVTRSPSPDDSHSLMAQRLNLTESQSQQLHNIWLQARTKARRQFADRRTELREQRDESIRQMLSPEDSAKYKQIQQQYRERVAELTEERREAFESTRQQTHVILNEQQARQWDEITRHRRERLRHGHRGPSAPGLDHQDDGTVSESETAESGRQDEPQ